MNRLIVACRDDASVFRRAAAAVIDPQKRQRLLEQSRQRRGFVEALSDEVTAAGGRPAALGSIFATVSAYVGALRGAIGGAHEGDCYAACMRTEQRTERAYARAARESLPSRARNLVDAQAREVAESCVELTELRGRH